MNGKTKNFIVEKTFTYALEIIDLYKILDSKREFVISKQVLRSGTSIGANVRESQNAESAQDFIHKLSIAQKETNETLYWLELLYQSNYIDEKIFQNLFSEWMEILKILRSSIITMKNKKNISKNS